MTTPQNALATRWIGTCTSCGDVIRTDDSRIRYNATCWHRKGAIHTVSVLGPAGATSSHKIAWRKMTAKVTTQECNSECKSARTERCACSCGGKHHGEAWGVL